MFSTSSSSALGFFVDPLGLPLFLFMTINSVKEARGHYDIICSQLPKHENMFQASNFIKNEESKAVTEISSCKQHLSC
jgi:hypothetical protein